MLYQYNMRQKKYCVTLLFQENRLMTKASQSLKALPSLVGDQLQKLGKDISLARKRRRLSMKSMAERMMVSIDTIQRLEKGDPAVSIGIVTTALWVLGLHQRMGNLISPESDTVGMQQDLARLPRDFRNTKKQQTDYDF